VLPIDSARSKRALMGVLLGLLVPVQVMPGAIASAAAATPTTCADRLLTRPQPAADAVPDLSRTEQQAVASLNDLTLGALRDVTGDGPAGDDTLWLDRCGRGFYVDPADPVAAQDPATPPTVAAAGAASGPAGPLADTFSLQSDPSSTHTIYLDFDGQAVSGTAWNDSAYGSAAAGTITAPPYSLDTQVDTDFSSAELTQIQRAWLVVAEDYAPYDVNITTRDPGTDALQRTSEADTRYGVRVLVTADGPIYDYCHCGGVAYVGVYDQAGAQAYQPAWVFTRGTTTDGVALAQAVSHEAGHTLGLHHDGTSGSNARDYYAGSGVWAPIMGASYYSPLTQWSSGEYPSANNPEDDIATIGGVLGVRPDDRANGLAGAESLPAATTSQRDGLIGTRTDVDAFTLRTGKQTKISVQPSGFQPDVDLSLTVTEPATGRVVATVNPASASGRGVAADGLGADYLLPAGPTSTYLISVDGVGNGNPAVAGHYSDYGSEGAYRLTVVPAGAPQPLAVDETAVSLSGTVGQTWDAVATGAFTATGGTTPYAWSATGLPPGAQLDRVSGRLRGPIGTAGSWSASVTVTDANGATAVIAATLVARLAATRPSATPLPPRPSWRTVAVGRARIGRAYRATLTVAGGSGTLRWTRAGTLPPGIRLAVADAGRRLLLTGKGHKRGRWQVRLVGKDAAGRMLTRTVRLAVKR
jgi:hypothetical protein